MAYRLENHPHQVVCRRQEVLEGLAAGTDAGPARHVDLDILDGRLELVEAVVQPTQVVFSDDELTLGYVQGIRPAARLVGPLAMGGGAELRRPTGARPLLQPAMAPAAPPGRH